MNYKTISLTCFFLLGWLSYSLAQNIHPYFRNYTTDDGLPSPEVHYCLQDSKGYMWFATDNGVSRFDGYTFKNYGPQEGLKDPVIFHLQEDSQGRIWMASMFGTLYYYEQDSIHVFAHNSYIAEHTQRGAFTSDFYINSGDSIYLSSFTLGLFLFSPNTSPKLIQPKNRLGGNLSIPLPNRWITAYRSGNYDFSEEWNATYKKNNLFPPLEILADTPFVIPPFSFEKENSSDNWMMSLFDHSFFYKSHNLYQIDQQQVLWTQYFPFNIQRKAISSTTKGQLILGALYNKGLLIFPDLVALKNGQYQTLLAGKSISQIFRDSKDGYWIATLEHGVFYCPSIEQVILDKGTGLSTDYVSTITFKNDSTLLIGMRDGVLYNLDLPSYKLTKYPSISTNLSDKSIIYDVLYDDITRETWVSNGANAYFKDGQWKRVFGYTKKGTLKNWGIGKRMTKQSHSRRIWGGNVRNFAAIDIDKKAIVVNSIDMGILERTLVVWEAKNGKIWVGNTRGIFELRDTQLISPPLLAPYQTRVEDLAELADSTLVIATKGNGVLLWKDSLLRQFTVKDGLSSNMIENVHVDESDRIWIGTLEGLTLMTPQDKQYDIKKYTISNGLPSNEITQVRARKDQVWVATTRGLLKWETPPAQKESRPPNVEKWTVNGITQTLENTQLGPNQNNLRFEYVTINYKIDKKIAYRLRLNDNDWTYTQDRSVNFANLAPRSYQFEVQAQNEDGIWSPSTTHTFQISPPFWQTNWFSLLTFFLLGLLVYGFLQWRIRQIKQQNDLAQQMTDLQQSALRAQVNPHFIFNCLNSIQNFISNNDTVNANRYLARFATLVRGILKASMEDKIRLAEDLQIMENYLELEQLRFKNKFQFNVQVDPQLDQFDMLIPPLIVQPFVENAIKHGMEEKKEKGIIEVTYLLNNQQLEITIQDNGKGIYVNQRKKGFKSRLLKSVGIEITQKRLQLNGWQPATLEENKDENGLVIGTIVRLKLPI